MTNVHIGNAAASFARSAASKPPVAQRGTSRTLRDVRAFPQAFVEQHLNPLKAFLLRDRGAAGHQRILRHRPAGSLVQKLSTRLLEPYMTIGASACFPSADLRSQSKALARVCAERKSDQVFVDKFKLHQHRGREAHLGGVEHFASQLVV